MKKLSLIYQHSITVAALFAAWKDFLRDKKNRPDVAEFQTRLTDNLIRLSRELSDKTYKHGGYYAFKISDPKPRDIHKASVRDRVVHHLLYNILYTHFDARFIYDSYSSRLEKGTHRALDRFDLLYRKASQNYQKTVWILKCDIRKFFANIDHKILKRILEERIESPEVLWLIDVVIDSFHTEGKVAVGLPLGNLTSQLLVNVYMNEFDAFAKKELKTRHYIRYADDFVIVSQDKEWLVALIPRISSYLDDHLALELHPDKVSIKTSASGVDFLGWIHFPDHRILRTATKKRMFRNIEQKEGQEATVASYLGMLSHGNAHKLSTKVLELKDTFSARSTINS